MKIGRTCYAPHGGGSELAHDSTCDGDTRKNGCHGKGQTPRTGVGKHITTNEASQKVGHKCHFLWNSLLYQIWTGKRSVKSVPANAYNTYGYPFVCVLPLHRLQRRRKRQYLGGARLEDSTLGYVSRWFHWYTPTHTCIRTCKGRFRRLKTELNLCV